MRGDVVGKGEGVEEHVFDGVVGRELRGVHEDGARGVGGYAAEEGRGAFVAGHAQEAVERVFVVAAGGGRFAHVGLHADVEDVAGVAGYAA